MRPQTKYCLTFFGEPSSLQLGLLLGLLLLLGLFRSHLSGCKCPVYANHWLPSAEGQQLDDGGATTQLNTLRYSINITTCNL